MISGPGPRVILGHMNTINAAKGDGIVPELLTRQLTEGRDSAMSECANEFDGLIGHSVEQGQ